MVTTARALAAQGELEGILEARGFAYALLARAFVAEPVQEQVQDLAESGAVRFFPFGGEHPAIQEGIAAVDAFLGDAANWSAAAFDRLLWDFTRLFVGPARLPAPPYESAYRTADRLLFQESTLEVRQAYLRYGLAAAHMGAEPDDHIGLELGFLYETCRMAAEAVASGDVARAEAVLRDQQAFLDAHLLKWVPAFAADVRQQAETGFYRGWASLLAGFVEIDRSLLRELLSEQPPEQPSR